MSTSNISDYFRLLFTAPEDDAIGALLALREILAETNSMEDLQKAVGGTPDIQVLVAHIERLQTRIRELEGQCNIGKLMNSALKEQLQLLQTRC